MATLSPISYFTGITSAQESAQTPFKPANTKAAHKHNPSTGEHMVLNMKPCSPNPASAALHLQLLLSLLLPPSLLLMLLLLVEDAPHALDQGGEWALCRLCIDEGQLQV